ncbi:dUTP diphosphatase [Mediannikoviicoccus vaginalis]|uniref:dUTP diphosphatase n=1 Tax=Mediannikoviicoccus vaginalis TaxID=2899727 RepID=UPI001F00F662|nr:dUTP diphosphatase [Mediannikoviicoccus vaginalis]
MIVKVINKSNNPLPKYATEGSAGLDVHAFLEEPVIIKPLERKIIPTGLYLEIPNGYEIQVRARSGMSIKHGITLVNGVGTIDSDYRGELGIPVINLSNEEYEIKSGDKVAQIILAKYEHLEFKLEENLEETDRSDGGFGHTGY